MTYLGLNKRIYKLNTSKYLNQSDRKSKLHLKIRGFLKDEFRLQTILEEPAIKGFGKALYFDFMLPVLKICVEANGQQHFKHIVHFHKSKSRFLLAQNNDRLKQEWCTLNKFTLINLNHNEDEEDWKRKLNDSK